MHTHIYISIKADTTYDFTYIILASVLDWKSTGIPAGTLNLLHCGILSPLLTSLNLFLSCELLLL